jgi:hypothetical protein
VRVKVRRRSLRQKDAFGVTERMVILSLYLSFPLPSVIPAKAGIHRILNGVYLNKGGFQ